MLRTPKASTESPDPSRGSQAAHLVALLFVSLLVLLVAAAGAFVALSSSRDGAESARTLIAISAGAAVVSLGLSWMLRQRELEAKEREGQSVRVSEEELRTILDSIADGIIATDEAGRVMRMNRVAETLSGWRSAAARGKPLAEVLQLVHEGTTTPLDSPLQQVLAEGVNGNLAYDATLVTRDGTVHPIGDSIAPIRGNDGKIAGAAVVFRDVTRERDGETRFRRVLGAAPDAMIIAKDDGSISFVNAQATVLFGYSSQEFATLKVEELLPESMRGPHAAHRQAYHAEPTVRPMGKGNMPLRGRRKDGTTFPAAISLSPLRTHEGVFAIAAVRDITAEREAQAELERAKERAEAANRELEAFSYSVAHDLRAPLRSIDGFSRALLEDHGPALPESGRADLETVCAAARRMGELIDDLLALSRVTRGELRRVPTDLTALAREVANHLARRHPERAVDVDIAEGMAADVDPRLFRVALENLLGNAWKFTRKVGAPRIIVGRKSDGEHAFFVQDNGAGFAMERAGRLFIAFQRLHRDGEFEGNGIGLATVERVVHRHGGRIWAEAEVGKGATFLFTVGQAS